MPCFRPITAYRTNYVNPETGKRGITFSRSAGYSDMEIQVPCGKCLGCQNKQTNEWALRCTHEAQFHERNCFITLTYDDLKLPDGYQLEDGLVHAHFQKFMKRLRKHFTGVKIKYFMCGEYGGKKGRPHFHALLFGIDFEDQVLHSTTGKVKNYISPTLERLWPFGFHTIGSVHYGTAKYTAKYSMKSLGMEGGDYGTRRPEYRKMSQGIGADYAIKYAKDIERDDNIILNGVRNPVPRYYEKYLNQDVLSRMKDERIKYLKSKVPLTQAQYRILEKCAHAKQRLYSEPNAHYERLPDL